MSILGRGDLVPPRRRHHYRRWLVLVLAVAVLCGLGYFGYRALFRGTSTGTAAACVTTSPSPAPPVAAQPRLVRVQVLNATSVNGLAARVAIELRGRGFVVAGVGNARSHASGAPQVRYAGGGEAGARLLALHVQDARVTTGGRPGVAQLVITTGWKGLVPDAVAAAAQRAATAAASARPTPSVSCAP